MRDEEARRIGGDCLRASEIAEIEANVAAADLGAWRVVGGQIERLGGKPFERPVESLRLAARSVELIPRLLRGVRLLESRYALARAEVASWKNQACEARDDARVAAERRAAGRTGPEWEIGQLARYLELFAAIPPERRSHSAENIGHVVRAYMTRWMGGESIGADVRSAITSFEARVDEERRFRAERAAEEAAEIARLRTTLGDWIARLEAGEVPAELAAQWARKTKQERAAFLKERRDSAPR